MPSFGTLSLPPALYQGDSYLAWNNESPGANGQSQEAALAIDPGANGQSVSVEIVFAADPGVFEVDVMTADTDTVNDFVSIKAINAVNSHFVARAEISPVVANFVSLFIKTLTNNVALTAKVSLK